MSQTFNADEIFGIGIEIEKNGRAFYRAAAEQADDQNIKALFQSLADMEDDHIAVFSSLRDEATGIEAYKDVEGANQELAGHLKTIADGHVFLTGTPVEQLARECRSVKAALSLAIGFEKDSVVLYAAFKQNIPAKLGQDKIEYLIQEELKHVGMLTGELNKIA